MQGMPGSPQGMPGQVNPQMLQALMQFLQQRGGQMAPQMQRY
jgi:hypothetical protein